MLYSNPIEAGLLCNISITNSIDFINYTFESSYVISIIDTRSDASRAFPVASSTHTDGDFGYLTGSRSGNGNYPLECVKSGNKGFFLGYRVNYLCFG